MENPFLQIKNAVISLLKELDPDIDVYAEEIKRTKDEEESQETYYFVDILPTGNQTVDSHYTDMGVLVDIVFHDKKEKNAVYLQKQIEIDEKIRPVFRFGDRKVTINNASMKISDHVLHYSFPLAFRICREKAQQYERMGELETTIKEGM